MFVERLVGFTVTVTALLCPAVSAPEVGFTVIHEVAPLVLQLNVPSPVFVIVKVCDAEFVHPCVMMNDRNVGLSPMAGDV